MRGIVDEAFRRRAVLGMEPRIRALADELAGELFADGSPADIVERYARMLPLSVICELLGLPLADRPKFIAWANTVVRLTNVIDFLRMIGAYSQMRRYLEERLQHARADGGDRDCLRQRSSKASAGTVVSSMKRPSMKRRWAASTRGGCRRCSSAARPRKRKWRRCCLPSCNGRRDHVPIANRGHAVS